jgi:hypothetical protein
LDRVKTPWVMYSLAVGSPGEAVEQLMAVLEPEAGLHDLGGVGAVVAIGVAEEEKVRCLSDEGAAVAEQDGGGEVEAVGPDVDLVGAAIGVGVFEDFDAVAGFFAGFGAERVLVEFDDPQAAALVPGHGHGIDDLGFGGEEADLEAFRHGELALGVVRGRARGWRLGRAGRRVGGRKGRWCRR